MKKTALTLAIILVFVVLFSAESASAQRSYKPPQITILSPSSNETYNSSSVSIKVKIVTIGGYPWYHDITSLNYSLDGQQDVPISFATDEAFIFLGNGTLSILSNGLHSVSVHGESIYTSAMGDKISHFNATASFTVEAPDTDFSSLTPTPESQLEPFPTTLVITSVCVDAILAIGVLVYFKKLRK